VIVPNTPPTAGGQPAGHQRVGVGWTRWIPAVEQCRSYERAWFGKDLLAGAVLVALLAPAGMAYAQASGLPPITGLYATILPLLAYAVLGPSQVLVMGPDSSLVPLVAAVVIPLAGSDPGRSVALAGLLAIFVGVIGILAGLARFGFLAELLSAPVRYGYLNGIALTIVVSQLPRAFGFSVTAETLVGTVGDFVHGLGDGRTNGWAVGITAAGLIVIFGLRRVAPKVPGVLVVVIAAISVTVAFGLSAHGLNLVGDLPSGFPRPILPRADWESIGRLTGAAFGIAFVAFADTSVLARVYALKRGTRVDANQELVALGVVNVAAGFFQGFPVSGSQSRTPVAEAAGARTQLTGVVAAVLLLLLLVLAPGAFRNLPQPVLAAVVIAAALRIFALGQVGRLAAIRRSEFLLSIVAFLAVAMLGAIIGVAVAIALSLLNFMRKAWKPHTTELVRVDGLRGYHDSERHPEGRRIPGLLLYRFDAPLFFANSRFFVEDVVNRVDRSPTRVDVVVVTAEPITDVDTTAADAIEELIRDLAVRDVTLRFAGLKGHVRERLQVYGLVDLIGPQWFARTTGEAVHTYVQGAQIEWVDWQDDTNL
jgi:high affinity sulfate transporter 1